MDYNKIPRELMTMNQWVCWRFETRDNKPTKIPINPHTGGNAMSNNSKTWGTFQQAISRMHQDSLPGIGFMFSGNGIVGIDIDSCRDRETGELTAEATDIISTLNSYTEISQSGKGIHILCRGALPAGARRRGNVEMYEKERYFIMTGATITTETVDVKERTQEIAIVHAKYLQKAEMPKQEQRISQHVYLDESDIIQKALSSSAGFAELMNGTWQSRYTSQSDADMALCNHLAFWTRCNPNTMDRLFRQSGLFRSKWDEQRPGGTYGHITIQKAISDCLNVYDPESYTQNSRPPQPPPEFDLGLDYLDDKKAQTKHVHVESELSFEARFSTWCKNSGTYKPKNLKENILRLLDYYNITCRYNEILKDLELYLPGKNFSQDNNDEVMLEFIFNKCIYHSFSGLSKDRLNAMLLEIGDENRFNPVAEYLQSVHAKHKDSVTAHPGAEMAKLINTIYAPTYPEDMKITLISKWIISCVAAALKPEGVCAHGALILQGAQGIGKTTWFRNLVPDAKWFKDGATIDPSSKDKILTAIQFWIVEMGEIESTFKKDFTSLKAFLTSGKDVIRRPYARKDSKYPRKTIFCGSVNSEQFLKDDTGNRRFWVLKCEDINYNHKVNIDLMWAEAVQMYLQGCHYWLSPEENTVLNALNKAAEETDSIDALLEINFRWETNGRYWLKCSDIFKIIGSPPNIGLRRIVAAIRRRTMDWQRGTHWRVLDGYTFYAMPREINANLYHPWNFLEAK